MKIIHKITIMIMFCLALSQCEEQVVLAAEPVAVAVAPAGPVISDTPKGLNLRNHWGGPVTPFASPAPRVEADEGRPVAPAIPVGPAPIPVGAVALTSPSYVSTVVPPQPTRIAVAGPIVPPCPTNIVVPAPSPCARVAALVPAPAPVPIAGIYPLI